MPRMPLDEDFFSLRSLAEATLVNVTSAPVRLRKTEETLQSLITVLGVIEDENRSNTSFVKSDGALAQRLNVLISLCLTSLTKLSKALENTSTIETADAGGLILFGSLAEPESAANSVDVAQRELSMRYTDIAELVNTTGMGGTRKMEDEAVEVSQWQESSQEQETMILEAVDKILTDESMPKAEHNDDQSTIWKHLRDRLKLSGFHSSDVERHKTTIFHKIHETIHLHHSALSVKPHARVDSVVGNNNSRPASPSTVRPPSMTFHEHLRRSVGVRSSNYRPPAASTIYDSDDDDARSVGSDASTLLGPIDQQRREENVLRPLNTQHPSERNNRPTASPRSPSFRLEIPEEKIVDLSSSPRSPRDPQSRGWTGLPAPPRTHPNQRNGAPLHRPNSPRERDSRFDSAPRRPSSGRNLSANSKYEHDVLVGRRSTVSPIWKYRRNNDMFPPRTQSMDVQDDALPTAAAEGRMNEVQRLLWEGKNIESFGIRTEHMTRNFHRTTALYRAAKQGHFAIVHLLLLNGANPNPMRKDGKSLVRLLADDGATEMLRLLLEYDAEMQRQGALPQAALFGHMGVIQVLLEYGVDIDEVEKQTALYRAASKGFPQICELLLREGANVHFLTSNGHSALYKAVQNENYQCARLLLQYGARPDRGIGRYAETVLHVAADSGHEQIVRTLLRRGALPNEANGYGTTAPIEGRRRYPLHFAARGGHVAIAKLLLEYGADVNVLTEDGRGPLDMAMERRHDDMVDLLSRAGGYPQQAIRDRSPGYRVQDTDSPRASRESQLRRFSSSAPDRPDLERPRPQRRASGLQAARSFEERPRPRERSTGARRPDNTSQHSSSSSKINATAAVSLLASGLMMLGGG